MSQGMQILVRRVPNYIENVSDYRALEGNGA